MGWAYHRYRQLQGSRSLPGYRRLHTLRLQLAGKGERLRTGQSDQDRHTPLHEDSEAKRLPRIHPRRNIGGKRETLRPLCPGSNPGQQSEKGPKG